MENEANDAWVKRDVEAYARLLADDYLATGPDGNMMTKAQDLASLKSDENTTTYMVADDFRVRVYGDAAVVTFRSTYKSQFKGKESTGQERFTDTWVKRVNVKYFSHPRGKDISHRHGKDISSSPLE